MPRCMTAQQRVRRGRADGAACYSGAKRWCLSGGLHPHYAAVSATNIGLHDDSDGAIAGRLRLVTEDSNII